MNDISTQVKTFSNNELCVPITDDSGNIGSHDDNAKKPADINPVA